MTRTQQKAFIRDLSRSITREITTQISTGKIPPNWDGHELRVLLSERHAMSASMSVIAKNGRTSRARNYRNTVLVNNLL